MAAGAGGAAAGGAVKVCPAARELHRAMERCGEGTFDRFNAWLAEQHLELADVAGGPEQETREVLLAFYRQPGFPWPSVMQRLGVIRELMGRLSWGRALFAELRPAQVRRADGQRQWQELSHSELLHAASALYIESSLRGRFHHTTGQSLEDLQARYADIAHVDFLFPGILHYSNSASGHAAFWIPSVHVKV
eukprot:TRINITY_DN27328_c0_g1_i2.p1 TRINITY_DN27328_c0_g1~~TRINITY_DN27328_c0_g1_i2.p1  ORF type:complete len:219 (+),score=44.60 TRINITY_DN27328_c0_g1_i2:82-657(+)